ncbi:dynamin-1-like protein isoform X2 [Gopherus evgoodei]|uniref:dynamin-1-like protein isoform X2 n=1 Tax=Gopherus evgoodei TaxID=1825980 RepID=UPI0011CEE310|nr:dynamin-1-like protein isoform X2 [Gopherus evgoodei]
MQVHNLVSIELAYINTKHPDFMDTALVSASVSTSKNDPPAEGSRRWKSDKVEDAGMEEKPKGNAQAPMYSSPSRSHAVNLLDTVNYTLPTQAGESGVVTAGELCLGQPQCSGSHCAFSELLCFQGQQGPF